MNGRTIPKHTEKRLSWEAKGSSSSQNFTEFYGRKFMTVFVTARHFFPILSQMNPDHVAPYHYFKLQFSVISQPPLRLLSDIFSSGFPHQNCPNIFILLHACHKPIPTHHLWFDRPENIWRWVYIIKFLVIQLPPSSYFLPI